MFTVDEKDILIRSLLIIRNVIETGNPYISANDAFRRKEQGIVTKIKAEPRALSETNIEEILKINKLITKIQTAL